MPASAPIGVNTVHSILPQNPDDTHYWALVPSLCTTSCACLFFKRFFSKFNFIYISIHVSFKELYIQNHIHTESLTLPPPLLFPDCSFIILPLFLHLTFTFLHFIHSKINSVIIDFIPKHSHEIHFAFTQGLCSSISFFFTHFSNTYKAIFQAVLDNRIMYMTILTGCFELFL